MNEECGFFNLDTYSSDFRDWNKSDWPEKIWRHISDRQLCQLFEDPITAFSALNETQEVERMEDDTPRNIVSNTSFSALDIVKAWVETLNTIPETCQFNPTVDGERCIFHGTKDDDKEDDLAREQILSEEVTSLIGANLSNLDISHANLKVDTNQTLRLDFCDIGLLNLRRSRLEKNLEIKYASIETFEFDHAHFEADLDVSHTEISEELTGSHAVFEGQLYGVGADISTNDEVQLDETIFQRYVCFDDAYFEQKLNIWNGVFEADVEFRSAVFEQGIDARWMDSDRFVDFHKATCRDTANFGGATFYDDVGFSEGTFESNLDFQTDYNSFKEFAAVFHGVADFTGINIHGALNMRETEFKKYASFKSMKIGGEFELWNAEFHEDADFRESVFTDVVDLRWSKFHGFGDFNETKFQKKANLGGARFADDIGFSDAVFEDKVSFRGEFDEYDEYKGECEGIADFSDVKFEDSLDLRMIFRDDVSFERTEFKGNIDITAVFEHDFDAKEAKFHGNVDFSGSSFKGETVFESVKSDQIIELTDVNIAQGIISQPEDSVTYYDFSRSTIGGVDFEPLSDKDLFSYLKFCETDFDGFDFPHHGAVLIGNWQLHKFEIEDKALSTNQLINTYLKAKNAASDVGSQTAAAEFFMQEMRYRRKAHWDSVLQSPPLQKLNSIGRWLSNWFLNLSCGYGERPIRTILASMFLIGFFSVLYWFAGLSPEGSPLTYVLFSTQAFVTFIFGNTPDVESTVVQFLATGQGFLGAFYIALFVFALTRSINR